MVAAILINSAVGSKSYSVAYPAMMVIVAQFKYSDTTLSILPKASQQQAQLGFYLRDL